jgi:hypothetical protein
MVAGFRKGCKAERPWPDVRPALLESLIAARELNQINLTLNLREPAGVGGYLDNASCRTCPSLPGAAPVRLGRAAGSPDPQEEPHE